MEEQEGSKFYQSRTIVPIPDPTALTTEQLRLGLQNLREVLETRIAAIESRHAVLREDLSRQPIDRQQDIQHLREFLEQRIEGLKQWAMAEFSSVQVRFREREIQVESTLAATREALTIKTEASDRAIAKAEQQTAEQLRQHSQLLNSTRDGLSDRLEDVKTRVLSMEGVKERVAQIDAVQNRLTTMEGRGSGHAESWQVVLGVFGLVSIISAVVMAIILAMR